MPLSQEAIDYFKYLKELNFQIEEKDVDSVEEKILYFKGQFPKELILSFFYNEFRIANISKVKKKRPQVLLGSAFNGNFPNLHTYPLLDAADVMCLVCGEKQIPFYAAINCNPGELFFNILKNLPVGFVPDFYLDHQVEKGHFIPQGIEMAPFPIIATVCHTFFHKSIEHICYLFDKVLPLSNFHADILRKKFPDKILEMPFGLNWGSFDHFLTPTDKKTIDVVLTFDVSDAPSYQNHRNEVVEKIKEFKEKHGDKYNIIISPSLPFDQYLNLIRESLIVINVTGVHGPYNYRTVETMCSGSLVFQYDWDDPFFKNRFDGIFKDGVHGVGFTLDNLESKLLHFLEHKDEALKIAQTGCQFVQSFNYVDLYNDLIKQVNKIKIDRPRPLANAIGYHHIDMVYFNQGNPNMNTLMTFGPLFDFCNATWIKYNNLMINASIHQETSLSDVFLLALLIEPLMSSLSFDKPDLCKYLYETALKETPEDLKWIVEWNYLVTLIELNLPIDQEFRKLEKALKKAKPIPFEEEKIIFRYLNNDYFDLNIELMKKIDSPQERAASYLNYARTALSKLTITAST